MSNEWAEKFPIFQSIDERGSFSKIATENENILPGKKLVWSECYITNSTKGVIRGMHFQLPPAEHHKIIYCLSGSIFDVCVDLRKHSSRFGSISKFAIDSNRPDGIYVPPGYAHGFQSLEDNTALLYLVSSSYDPELDTGLHPLSFDIEWPLKITSMSCRDKNFKYFDPEDEYFS